MYILSISIIFFVINLYPITPINQLYLTLHPNPNHNPNPNPNPHLNLNIPVRLHLAIILIILIIDPYLLILFPIIYYFGLFIVLLNFVLKI